MIALMRRILRLAEGYGTRIRLAAVCSLLKAFLSKAPIVIAFYMISGFIAHTVTGPQLHAEVRQHLEARPGLEPIRQVLEQALQSQAEQHGDARQDAVPTGDGVSDKAGNHTKGDHERRFPEKGFEEGADCRQADARPISLRQPENTVHKRDHALTSHSMLCSAAAQSR